MLCYTTQRSTNRGKDGRPSVMVLRALLPPPLATTRRRPCTRSTKKKLGTPTKTRVRSGARHQLLFNCSTMLNWGASPLFWAAPALWVFESTATGLTSWPRMGIHKGPTKMLCTRKDLLKWYDHIQIWSRKTGLFLGLSGFNVATKVLN